MTKVEGMTHEHLATPVLWPLTTFGTGTANQKGERVPLTSFSRPTARPCVKPRNGKPPKPEKKKKGEKTKTTKALKLEGGSASFQLPRHQAAVGQQQGAAGQVDGAGVQAVGGGVEEAVQQHENGARRQPGTQTGGWATIARMLSDLTCGDAKTKKNGGKTGSTANLRGLEFQAPKYPPCFLPKRNEESRENSRKGHHLEHPDERKGAKLGQSSKASLFGVPLGGKPKLRDTGFCKKKKKKKTSPPESVLTTGADPLAPQLQS